MLEISFAKLLVVFIVGLIVVGPERLPKLAHFIGRYVGKLRFLAHSLHTEISEQKTAAQNSSEQRKIQHLEEENK